MGEYAELDKKVAVLCVETKNTTEKLSHIEHLLLENLNKLNEKVTTHEVEIKNINQWRLALPKSIGMMVAVIQLFFGVLVAAATWRVTK